VAAVIFAAVQHDIVWEDPAATRAGVERLLAAAPPPRGAFLLLPELGDTGFSFDLDRVCGSGAVEWAAGLAQSHGVHLQVGHAERGADGLGRNRASIVGPCGGVLAEYDKVHPFSFAGEERHYRGGESIALLQAGAFVVCPMICYDLRFPELWRLATLAGAEVFTIGAEWLSLRSPHWRSLLIARAIENQAFVVACNRVGEDPRYRYLGGSLIVAPTGEVLAEAGSGEEVVSSHLDPELLHRSRSTFPALADLRRSLLGSIPVRRSGSADAARDGR